MGVGEDGEPSTKACGVVVVVVMMVMMMTMRMRMMIQWWTE